MNSCILEWRTTWKACVLVAATSKVLIDYLKPQGFVGISVLGSHITSAHAVCGFYLIIYSHLLLGLKHATSLIRRYGYGLYTSILHAARHSLCRLSGFRCPAVKNDDVCEFMTFENIQHGIKHTYTCTTSLINKISVYNSAHNSLM